MEETRGNVALERKDSLILESEDGDSIELEVIATINIEGGNYLLAHPQHIEGISENEVLAIEIKEEEDEVSYRIETDTDIIEKVYEEYNALRESSLHKLC